MFGAGNDIIPIQPSRKKPIFPVKESLRRYLLKYSRELKLPASYKDLMRFTYSVPLKNKKGIDTAWETVTYDMREWEYLRESLVNIYAILKTEGDMRFASHLDVSRIDFCAFGNSQPFRIRIVNRINDNYDHYYIKPADTNRIYGLELEHLLSPNRMMFVTWLDTLVEEHIPGIPGDDFINQYLTNTDTNIVRLAKEFVKFNERCFVRLLGDMRSYNFVISITPDIEDFQYRIRAIDFDQQCYEGRKNLYLPQYFKDNNAYVNTVLKHLDQESIAQYQAEERTMMALRLSGSRHRIKELLDILYIDEVSVPEKINQLKAELAVHHDYTLFLRCNSMGQVLRTQLKQTLHQSLAMIPGLRNKFDD